MGNILIWKNCWTWKYILISLRQRSAIPVFLRSILILRLKSSTGRDRDWDWYSKPWYHDTETETDTQNIGIMRLIPRLRLKSIMRLRLILRLYCISYVKLAVNNYENSAFANFINFFDTDTETDTQIGQNSIPRLILILRKLVSRDWDRDWDQKSHETGSIPRVSPTSAIAGWVKNPGSEEKSLVQRKKVCFGWKKWGANPWNKGGQNMTQYGRRYLRAL